MHAFYRFSQTTGREEKGEMVEGEEKIGERR
jgi:hypothetical protein